jgi:hypothetical protein
VERILVGPRHGRFLFFPGALTLQVRYA